MLLGIDATGCECSTSLYEVTVRLPWESMSVRTHPACVGIKKPPPDTVFANFPHFPATVEKHGKHAFTKIDNGDVLLGLGRLRRIVGH